MKAETKTPIVLLLDDDDLFRKAAVRQLRAILPGNASVVAVGDPDDIWPFVEAAALFITDGRLGQGRPNGLEMIAAVRRSRPTLACLLRSSDGGLVNELVRDNCTAGSLKSASREELRDIIRSIAPELLPDTETE